MDIVRKSSWKKHCLCCRNDHEIAEVFIRLVEEQNLKSREFSPMKSKNAELYKVVFAVNTIQVILVFRNKAKQMFYKLK